MSFKPEKPKIVVICGPTALGKTAAGIDLAMTFNGEIVGADSMQIYRYMDIGTAKPTADEQARATHHMIGIVDPDAHFDARAYARMAGGIIDELLRRGKTPFVVGGTGFYIKALLHGLFEARSGDPEVRRRLRHEAEALGAEMLHQRLRQVDPEAAQKLHPNDTYRIIRALETHETTGKTISEYQRAHRFQSDPFNPLKIGLHMERQKLYDRIDRRVDAMMAAGFVEEVRSLLDRGYDSSLKSMQSIGYRHVADFLQSRCSWDETVRTMKRDTRRYAKRQMTWFNADPEIAWYLPEQTEDIKQAVERFLQHPKASTF